MSTIQENLNTLSEIKASIKTAITNKGVNAGDDITAYGDKIRQISGGDDIDYLCFEALEDGAISYDNYLETTPNFEYSFDKEHWTVWDLFELPLNVEQKVYFRGINPNGFRGTDTSISASHFVIPFATNISGNIMTIIDGVGETNTIPATNCFNRLFAYQAGIRDCSNLKLPAIHLTSNCYGHMFRDGGITNTPKLLPALELSNDCYSQMFKNCYSLETAPELPATTLASQCYFLMFFNDENLKHAPYLPAKSIDINNCYSQMFYNCSSLQYIKAEFTTAPNTSYTSNWVSGVASTGCFIKAKDATWTTKSASACPSGWTLITSVS